jgi:hypothetical protein
MIAKYGNFSLRASDLDDTFDLLARVKRNARYRKTQRVDNELKSILDKYNVDYSRYGYALGNVDTSFNAIKKYTTKNPPYDDDI